MTTPTLDSFFSGGGGRSVSWKGKPDGTTVSGTIKAVNPPQQQTDPVDGSLQFKSDGVTPKMSVRIDLATSERDPSDPEDDGSRALFVQGWLQGAIGDALRKAGRQGPPEVGGQLTVTLTHREPNSNPKLSPINKFSAAYTSPAAASTGEFFGAQQPVPQPNIAGTGYAPPAAPAAPPQQQMTPEQVQAFLAQQGIQSAPVAEPLPPKPGVLSDAAWAQMDDDTKRRTASAMKDIPF